MKIFLISFEYENDAQLQSIVSAIKEYPSWARITRNTWCVKAEGTSASVRDILVAKSKPSNTQILVVNITDSPWGSYFVPKEVTDWLKEK